MIGNIKSAFAITWDILVGVFVNNKKGRMAVCLLAAFLMTGFLNRRVFVADSPTLQPYLARTIDAVADIPKATLAKVYNKTPWGKPAAAREFDSIDLDRKSNGVYSKERPGATYKRYRLRDVVWREYRYRVDGRDVVIKVPEGDARPSQETIEEIYR